MMGAREPRERELQGSEAPALSELERQTDELLLRWIPPLVHRLNNSLIVIHGAPRDATGQPLADREVELARGLLRELALLARRSAWQVEVLDLAHLAAAVVETARPSFEMARVGLALERPSGVVPARADAACLRRLVALLIDGALARAAAGRGKAEAFVRLVLAGARAEAILTGVVEGGAAPEPAALARAGAWARALGGALEPEGAGGWRLRLPA
jgi:hypothetical protein